MPDIYRLEKVHFQYDDQVVLSNVNFCIRPADFVGIVGKNGGGKTTLLRLLTGERRPLGGALYFFGSSGISPKEMHRIGYVPQINPSSGMSFPISAREMVALGLTRSIVPRFFLRREERRKVDQSLEHLGILDLAERNVHELSGGQKQRVMIAKALVDQPEVLLFDEPTVGIDGPSKIQFYETLKHMNEVHGMTILLVTHEIDLGKSYWNRLLTIREHQVEEIALDRLQTRGEHV